MKNMFVVACLTLSVSCFSNALYAQGATAGALPQNAGADFGEDRSALGLNPDQAHRLAAYIDRSLAMNRNDIKDRPSKEELVARANELITVLKLSCKLKDVDLAGLSTDTEQGKLYQNSLYEISCTDGLGYFLKSRDYLKSANAKPGHPVASSSFALSCLAADQLQEDDTRNGISSELYCHLADNGGGDIKTWGQSLLTRIGVPCNVTGFKWFGAKPDAKMEIAEAACDNSTGYLVQIAAPGGTDKPSAINCNDAIRNGLECKMTPVVKPVTLATFREYLEKTAIKCKISSYDQIKLLGRESTRQRYVVEFKCTEQPGGLVAFIPLENNTNPFETVDCHDIKKYGISCKLTSMN